MIRLHRVVAVIVMLAGGMTAQKRAVPVDDIKLAGFSEGSRAGAVTLAAMIIAAGCRAAMHKRRLFSMLQSEWVG